MMCGLEVIFHCITWVTLMESGCRPMKNPQLDFEICILFLINQYQAGSYRQFWPAMDGWREGEIDRLIDIERIIRWPS